MISPLIKRFCDFAEASPTAYHAAENIAALLDARGALRLSETEAWELEPGRLYYVLRSGSALIAFRPGLRPPAEEGFAIAGAHTDSPGLKARVEKPLSAKGLERAQVEIYGGPIVSSWLDRPLSLAGRAVVRGADGKTQTRLVNFDRPIGIVPNLAIHLNRELNKGFEYNPQTQLPVLLAARPAEAGAAASANGAAGAAPALAAAAPGAAPALLELLARELGLPAEAILSAELFFVDAQKCALVGEDLVNGYRLDDLLGCHAILEAFLAAPPAAHGQLACFFDNEEIGSKTIQGADSSLLRDTLGRISALQGGTSEGFYRALASSFSISVDVAQSFHPSYAERFDEQYAPLLNGGPAVKANANFRYATDAETEARFRLLCAEAGYPCQKFMSRSDIAPGTTIGPLSSALTGIRTVDVGSPLLSMHSIRETAGTRDHEAMRAALELHFRKSPRA